LWIALAFAFTTGAQPALRQFANADEYDVASQAFAETDPNRTIALLRDWVARYPKTEFERERLISFALAFQRLGDLAESLKRATELLALNASDPGALLFIAALGPTFPAASDSQIKTVTDCAVKLLSITLIHKPSATGAWSESSSGSASYVDAETQRVLAFIRRLRNDRGPLVRTDLDVVKRQVAETALEWAKNATR
jgi:hypothetical protein